MERTPHWSLQTTSATVSFTFTYHTWQFIIFIIFTITACIFSLVQSLILNVKTWLFGRSFLYRPFRHLPRLHELIHGLVDLTFLLCSTAVLVCMVFRLSHLLVGFRMHFQSFFHSFIQNRLPIHKTSQANLCHLRCALPDCAEIWQVDSLWLNLRITGGTYKALPCLKWQGSTNY